MLVDALVLIVLGWPPSVVLKVSVVAEGEIIVVPGFPDLPPTALYQPPSDSPRPIEVDWGTLSLWVHLKFRP